jgi:hypothetical protein
VYTTDLWSRSMIPRRSLKNSHECSGCTVYTLKLPKFTYIAWQVGLSIHSLKLHRADCLAVTKISVVHINAAHQKGDPISYSLFHILQLIQFPVTAQLPLKTCQPLNKSKIFPLLLLNF